MRTDQAVTIRRSDYRPPAFQVESIHLQFDLDPQATLVRSRLRIARSPATPRSEPLRLNGEALELLEASIDGAPIAESSRAIEEGHLVIANVPDTFELELVTRCSPAANSGSPTRARTYRARSR